MPGLVVAVGVVPGEEVTKGQKLVTMEAMKMETTVYAEQAGKVAEVLVRAQMQIESGDLMIRFE
jgi:pyruvate carboxylase